jgi:P-type Ca2+ transporter type 2C
MSSPVWHSRSVEYTAQALGTDPAGGLAVDVAKARLAEYGPNLLATVKPVSVWTLVCNQFRSLMVGLLVVATIIALALGDYIEAGAIVVVIVLNAVIGFVTEWKAESALDGLRKQVVAVARVVRGHTQSHVPAAELVPGDVVLLDAGDRVPADGRLVEAVRLDIDESALTGESAPVSKSTDAVPDPDAAPGDRTCMAHTGTAVVGGRGRFIVTTTGTATEMGRIGTLLRDVDARGTPLEAKLTQLSRALLLIVLVLCATIVGIGWLRGQPLLYMVEVGISLAVAAVPEGLLAVTTMTLAIGMRRMARMNALVRRLPAVESLGSTTVICSDKTGTLTRNEMTVRVVDACGQRVEVTGTGYAADGKVGEGGAPGDGVRLALRIGLLCNDTRIDRTATPPTVLGDPTEAALIVAAEKAGLEVVALHAAYPRIREVPFNSESKRMATAHHTPEGPDFAYVKGSPAEVLAASTSMLTPEGVVPMTDELRTQGIAANEALGAQALRVLGLAMRELPYGYDDGDLARELTFVGLVGMIDPLRDEAKATIAVCKGAGIRTIMITGDQQVTAAEIARQLGLDTDAQGQRLRTVHARELKDLDDEGWLAAVTGTAVFARVTPEHKLKIVDALQRQGQIVAMTGDGVNDAPALRKADIGIAMGIRGSEVAKDAAAMVITDDNFATIVGAVEQGRIIVHNILRFIHYLFSSNLAEIVTMFAAVVIGWPLPLGVLQILWLNLVTDIFPAMALALEPSAPEVMERPPRDPKKPLMTARFGWLIVWQGTTLAGCTLGAFAVGLHWYGDTGAGLEHAETLAFMTLALAQVFHAFNARSQRRSAFTSRLFTNGWLWAATAICIALQVAAIYLPPLRSVLRTVVLSGVDWGLVAAGALAPVVVVEVVKLIQRVLQPKQPKRPPQSQTVGGA